MYPIALDLSKLRIALVGSGPALQRRLAQLIEQGAKTISVYTEDKNNNELRTSQSNLFLRLPAAHEIGAAHVLMLVGLDDERTAVLASLARIQGVLVNAEDKPEFCDFFFTSFVARGDLLLSVSTSGASPVLSQEIRNQLAAQYGEEWTTITAELRTTRDQWKQQGLKGQELAEKTREWLTPRNLFKKEDGPKALSLEGRGLGEGGEPQLDSIEFARRLRKNSTEAESKLWQHLRQFRDQGYRFRRQHPFVEKYIADFICLERKLIIEVDGSQHLENNYDKRRTLFINGEGYTVLRFWNNDVLARTELVLEEILRVLGEASPSPQPSPLQGEGVL